VLAPRCGYSSSVGYIVLKASGAWAHRRIAASGLDAPWGALNGS